MVGGTQAPPSDQALRWYTKNFPDLPAPVSASTGATTSAGAPGQISPIAEVNDEQDTQDSSPNDAAKDDATSPPAAADDEAEATSQDESKNDGALTQGQLNAMAAQVRASVRAALVQLPNLTGAMLGVGAGRRRCGTCASVRSSVRYRPTLKLCSCESLLCVYPCAGSYRRLTPCLAAPCLLRIRACLHACTCPGWR